MIKGGVEYRKRYTPNNNETITKNHRGEYQYYHFEGGIYQQVEGTSLLSKLPNQREYDLRQDQTLMPYALVDTYDGSDLSGTTIRFQGKILEIGQDIFPPELQYFGFSTLAEAKAVQREHNNAGLYQRH